MFPGALRDVLTVCHLRVVISGTVMDDETIGDLAQRKGSARRRGLECLCMAKARQERVGRRASLRPVLPPVGTLCTLSNMLLPFLRPFSLANLCQDCIGPSENLKAGIVL